MQSHHQSICQHKFLTQLQLSKPPQRPKQYKPRALPRFSALGKDQKKYIQIKLIKNETITENLKKNNKIKKLGKNKQLYIAYI